MRLSLIRLLVVFLVTVGPTGIASATRSTESAATLAAAAAPAWPRSSAPHSPAPGSGARATGGPRWRLPLDGPVVVLRGFDPPAQPWLPGHRGVDLGARPGRLVRAAGSGLVGYAGPLAGREVVMIVHDEGLRTTYLPVQPSVRRGQVVKPGDTIGVVEDTVGHCPASCLHWGLIQATGYLDPLLLVGFGRIRLLPQWRSAGG